MLFNMPKKKYRKIRTGNNEQCDYTLLYLPFNSKLHMFTSVISPLASCNTAIERSTDSMSSRTELN